MKTVKLTDEEIELILNAIRISAEDGSIFGDDDASYYHEIEARIESIQKKLRAGGAAGA